ncbi:hypothetical protein nbrc107697_27040 [Gordonia crocea]|uniref:Uncharacterized protein n=1 Tax=Gordonia crocea TaxID=589162 RepID=A0A7I9UZW9_9ACTN|nr:hypothetical protein nbrc107697_27040 [Gordonia crocea]
MRGGQAVEDVDGDRRLADEDLGGIERGRAGADDGDVQRLVRQRRGLLRRDESAVHLVVLVVVGVDLQVGLVFFLELVVGRIASTGHSSMQAPQSMQVSGSM